MADNIPGLEIVKQELWVPTTFALGGRAYMLNATHRGDMYHIRAAMTLYPLPLILYSCTGNTVELQAYLQKNAPSHFSTPLQWEQLSAKDSPNDGNGPYEQRKFDTISEAEATTVIAAKIKNDTDVKRMAAGMAIISDANKDKITTEFEQLCTQLFAHPPDPSRKTILIQTRDTGTKGGIYPELDSGTDAVLQLAKYITDIPPPTNTQSLNIELCGNKTAIGHLHSIGEYFTRINATLWPSETKRDLEAYFLAHAFSRQYFDMAIGFRSGGLDVFTFLGAPTVSISIRQLVGEARHGKLAANTVLKRWNLQYERPRQAATRFVLSRGRRNLLGSPWWKHDEDVKEGRKTPSAEDVAKQTLPPCGFGGFDEQIVGMGVYHAVSALVLDRKVVPFLKPTVANHVFCNKDCRSRYWSDLTEGNAIRAFLSGQRGIEERYFGERRRDMENGVSGEVKGDLDDLEASMKKQWDEILGKKYGRE